MSDSQQPPPPDSVNTSGPASWVPQAPPVMPPTQAPPIMPATQGPPVTPPTQAPPLMPVTQAPPAPSPEHAPAPPGNPGWQWNPADPAAAPAVDYVPAAPQVTLPITPTRYHMFWRTPGGQWWRAFLALVVALGLFVVAQIVVVGVGVGVDVARGADAEESLVKLQEMQITPGLFLANNLGLAALIPIAWLASLIVGQRPRWMASVLGRFRWRWMLRCMLFLVPLWLVGSFIGYGGSLPELKSNPDTLFLILAIAFTTPLQAAGEEYGFRGLANRAVASWFARPAAGFVAGGLFSSLLFTIAHGAGDPWLWLFYFSFGMSACYLAWRTGGLEAPIAMHVVNNLFGLALMPWTDISSLFDRGAGSAGPAVLIQIAVMLLGVGVIEWLARRTKVVAVNDPGLEAVGRPVVGAI